MNRKSLLICLIVFMIVIVFLIIFSVYITSYYAGLNKKSKIVLPTESDVIDDPGNDQIENDALIVKLKTIGNTNQQSQSLKAYNIVSNAPKTSDNMLLFMMVALLSLFLFLIFYFYNN